MYSLIIGALCAIGGALFIKAVFRLIENRGERYWTQRRIEQARLRKTPTWMLSEEERLLISPEQSPAATSQTDRPLSAS